MNARERLQIMVRTTRGSMTVWSPPEVRAALDAYRAEVLREAADFIDNDDVCDCGGCDTCVPRKYAADLRRMADEGVSAEQLARFEDARHTLQQVHRPVGEIKFAGYEPMPLSGWDLTELAPDYYGNVYMQIGGWLPEGWPREETPGGTAQMKYAHLHGEAVPRDLNVQVSVKGYGGPQRFIKVQWRKDGAP
ncbi:hypothetical protein ACWC9Q_18305 [Streptomyces sp. NPDC001142]